MANDKNTAKQSAKLAAEAHTNLNTFGAVIAILEGGCVYGNTGASAGMTAKKIIAMCKAESGKQLALYDRHIDAIGHPPVNSGGA